MEVGRDSSGPFWPWVVGAMGVLLIGASIWFAIDGGQEMIPGDSPSYLSSAENLAEGNGYVTDFGDRGKPVDFDSTISPVVDFPPGYPYMLSLGIRSGLSVQDAAKVAAAVGLVAMGMMFLLYSMRRTGRPWISILVALLAMVVTIPFALPVLSEVVFGLLVAGALIALSSFVRSGNQWQLTISALLSISSVTVRTAGIAIVVVVAFAAIVRLRNPIARWSWSVGVVAAGAVAFLTLIGGGSRLIAWHPPDLVSLKVTTAAVVGLVVPPVMSPEVGVALFAAGMVALVIWVVRGAPTGTGMSFDVATGWWPGLLAAIAQAGLILLTRTLFDAQTDLNSRLLYPAVLSLLIAGVEYLASPARSGRGRRSRTGVVVVMSAALVAGAWSATSSALAVAEGERGIASVSFVESPTVHRLIESFDGPSVFANVPDSLWIAGLSGARPFPIRWDPLSLQPSERLESEVAQLRTAVADDAAALFFYRGHHRDYMITEEDAVAIAPCVVQDDGGSVILVAEDNPICPDG